VRTRRIRVSGQATQTGDAALVRRAALDLLARRDYGRAELRARLIRKLGSTAPVDEVLQQLSAERLLDEDRFIEAFIRAHRRKGHGPLRILNELNQRGIPADVAEAAVDPRDPGWIELARTWRARRFGDTPPRAAADWQRQARHLQSRGFSTEQVRHALRVDDD
jgi:regulatory protein